MVEAVDDDKSGQIEFGEFLNIVANTDDDAKVLTEFFKGYTSGEYKKYDSEHISFAVLTNNLKRKYLLNAIMSKPDSVERKQGRRILDNIKKHLDDEKKAAEKAELGEKESNKSGSSSAEMYS